MIRRRHTIKSHTFNVGGIDGISRAEFVERVAEYVGAENTTNLVRMTRKECPMPWAHKYPVPADIRMKSDSVQDFLDEDNLGVWQGIKSCMRYHPSAKVPKTERRGRPKKNQSPRPRGRPTLGPRYYVRGRPRSTSTTSHG